MATLDVNRLCKDDLIYELKLRGVEKEKTVAQMRSTLRRLLKLEDEGRVVLRSPKVMDIGEELQIVADRLEETQAILAEASSIGKVRKKVDTNLTHIMGRLSRIEPTEPELTAKKTKYLEKIVELWDKLDPAPEMAEGSPRESEEEVDEPIETPRRRATASRFLTPVTRFERPVLKTQIPIRDWGITFSGEGSTSSVLAFLDDLEFYREARNASYQDLFHGAIDLFKGPALSWFKSNKRKVSSWAELVERLKKEYLQDDYGDRLWREILDRRQGLDERFGSFLAELEAQFARLPISVTEDRQINIVINNSAPYFYDRLRMYDPKTMDDLCMYGRKIQCDKEHNEQYKPPQPSNRKPNVGPPPESYGRRRDVRVGAVGDSSPSAPTSECASTSRGETSHGSNQSRPNSTNQGSRPKCWNCDTVGHRFRQCPKLVFPFCVACGNKNLQDGVCQHCRQNNSGNARRGRR